MEHTFDGAYWDEVWHGDRAASMGSSAPNPHLLDEVGGLTPARALDAGCGSGAEAIWLVTHGWQVTAVDIATAALDRAEERAAEAGVAAQVEWVRADLAEWEPEATYDLVTTHYAHPVIPQLHFYDRIASWVSPGGTLLVVGHLHRGPDHGHGHGHGHLQGHLQGRGHLRGHGNDGPPPEASVTAADIAARLDPAHWEVRTARELQRTVAGAGGHGTTLHDVVVRATRRG